MKFSKHVLIVLTLALLTPLAAFASEKNQRRIDLADTVQVGNAHLKPGHYKVEWQGTGPAITVNFLHNGKTVATAPATLKMNDSQVTEDDIVTRKTSSNTKKLEEIDFQHQKEALIFAGKTSSSRNQS